MGIESWEGGHDSHGGVRISVLDSPHIPMLTPALFRPSTLLASTFLAVGCSLLVGCQPLDTREVLVVTDDPSGNSPAADVTMPFSPGQGEQIVEGSSSNLDAAGPDGTARDSFSEETQGGDAVELSAVGLTFALHPSNAIAGEALSRVLVQLVGDEGQFVAESGVQVSLSLRRAESVSQTGANEGAELIGFPQLPSIDGVVEFLAVGVNQGGQQYILEASAPGLQSVSSNPFNIRSIAFQSLSTSLTGEPILALKPLPGASGRMLATVQGGIVSSTDEGRTWQLVGFGGLGVSRTLEVRGSVVYAAPADTLHPQERGGTPFVRKSVDGGETWRDLVNRPDDSGVIADIVIEPRDSNIVFACGLNGIFVSTDAGERWQKSPYQGDCRALVSVSLPEGSRLIAAGFSENINEPHPLLSSVDGGATWQPLYSTETLISSLTVSERTVFAIEASGALNISPDGGATWFQPAVGVGVSAVAVESSFRMYASSGSSILISQDEGVTFGEPVDTGFGVIEHLAVGLSAQRPVYVGTQTGVYVSLNGGQTFSDSSIGFPSQSAESVSLHPDFPDVVLAGVGGAVYRSQDGGDTWRRTLQSLADRFGGSSRIDTVRFDPGNSNIAYACDESANFFRSTNGGEGWSTAVQLGDTSNCYDIVRVGQRLYIPSLNGLFFSSDNGASWSLTGLTVQSGALAASADERILYAGTQEGGYRSIDDGETWQLIIAEDIINAWFVDPAVPGLMYAGELCRVTATNSGAGGIRKSVDSGETWESLQVSGCIEAIRQVPGGPLFAIGNRSGLVLSVDEGTGWQPGGPGLGLRGRDFALSPDQQTLFVATERGLYRSLTGGL